MENKILSLEEIEKTQKEYTGVFFLEPKATAGAIDKELLFSLLATARAYHELKAAENTALGNAYDNGRYMAELELKDKPHAPTIKVFQEVLNMIAPYTNKYPPNNPIIVDDIMKAKEHLESILKEL